jgi:multidrug/hemolysin transport system permease protein
MNIILLLVGRNLRLFFRDHMAVFFALLSPLILLLLYTFFLGNQQVQNIQNNLPNASSAAIHDFLYSWLFAGIISIASLTTGLVALGVFVRDRESDRFQDFLVAPLGRTQMILGYLLAAFGVSALMSTILFVLSQAFIVLDGGRLLSGLYAVEAYGAILLLCLTFAALSSFVVTLIKSYGAFSAFNTILGTAVGFLSGAYIMADALPASVLNFMNILPFAQGAALLRQPFTHDSLRILAENRPSVLIDMERNFSIKLAVAGHPLHTITIIGIFMMLIVVFTGLGSWSIGKSIK